MASVTQTIPNYNGGISQQADERKFPGQVKDCINAIPHATLGLHKRPGSARVGTSALANVQDVGSFFHYYRDEKEGSYIGQVDTNGEVRMWKCSDGSQVSVHYDTAGQALDSSDADHVSITNYLTPSTVDGVKQTEDIQALTINDTTFLNNRSKTISTTGTTGTHPHTHHAFIDLLRSENGRQYSLNIHDPAQSGTTNITTVTRLKLKSDTLSEVAGTGHCPGIGTQVFSVSSAGTYPQGTTLGVFNSSDVSQTGTTKKNLIFRITTLGQQGTDPSANADDSGIDGGGYRCSYSRQITLLNGGEGWEEGDYVKVKLDSAATPDFEYELEVEKIETTPIKITINSGANGAIRPEPTPFDADTSVTADSILGGIASELSGTGLSYQIIGTGIYIYSDSQAFSITSVDKDIMRVMQSETNNVGNLPIQCKHGYIVKIANSQMSDEDDYYLKFEGENAVDGAGSWTECPKPGIVKGFNATTMPHILQRQTGGTFLVKKATWADREVGDDATNQAPSFCGDKNSANPAVYDQDRSINKVLFFRNRLVFLSNDSVITSRAGDLFNFWANTALTVSATDPIDIACSSTLPSELFDGVELTAGLLVFTTNQQYLLASDDTIFNPDTAKFRAIASYNYNKVVPPMSLGATKGFLDNTGKYSRFMEIMDIRREAEPAVVDSSITIPNLLPKDIDIMTVSRENGLVVLGKSGTKDVYLFRHLTLGGKRTQQAWFKWKFNQNAKYFFIVNDELYYLDSNSYLQKLNIIPTDDDLSVAKDSVDYLIHLDNWTTVTGGTYSTDTNLTTFTNQATWIPSITSSDKLVVIDTNATNTRIGRYSEATIVTGSGDDDFTLPGDWSTGTFYIGYLYDYQVDLPRVYITKAQGESVNSDTRASLIVHRLKFSFGKIGVYETTLNRRGHASPYVEEYESPIPDEYESESIPYLDEAIVTIPVYEKNENVDITLKSSHPAPATLRSMSWEGDYSPKYYRRV